MKKYAIAAIITAGLISLGILCYRLSKPTEFRPSMPTERFYLRSYRTGRLIGPVPLKSGHFLPPLDEQKYIVADPTESELEVRRCLLETAGYDSHYIDCELADVVQTINQMLKHRLGDKAPPVLIESVYTSQLPLITMDITKESAYDVLCNIAAKAQVRIIVEQGAIVLGQKEFREMSVKSLDSYEQ
ncbi:MAG TPA: hypothetical protein VMX36_13515 [Sedimentisphaerales bacterium]|nr:hypothetical protein [Sedimentisphaerales bacterium]